MNARNGAIDISSAGEEELLTLSGVGPALARRIVDWRAENGGFSSVDQLVEVPGLGEAKVEALRAHVIALPVAEAPRPRDRTAQAAPAPRAGPVGEAPADPGAAVLGYVRDNRLAVAVVAIAVASQVVLAALLIWVL